MKRSIFYALTALQVGILLLVGIQHSLIDDYGVTVKLLQEPVEKEDAAWLASQEEFYIEYEINKIQSDLWDVTDPIEDASERIYVLLEAGEDGVYHVKKAADEKLTPTSNQVMIVGKYQYSDNVLGYHYVNYGIERIVNTGQYDFKGSAQSVVTINISPWGQKKVVAIDTN